MSSTETPAYTCPDWHTDLSPMEVRQVETGFGALAGTLTELAGQIRRMDDHASLEISLAERVKVRVVPTNGALGLRDHECADNLNWDDYGCCPVEHDEGYLVAWESRETVGHLICILASARGLRPQMEVAMTAGGARDFYVSLHQCLQYREYTASEGGFRLSLRMRWGGENGVAEDLAARLEHHDIIRARLSGKFLPAEAEPTTASGPRQSSGLPLHPPGDGLVENIFRRNGDRWTVRFGGGETISLNDLTGMIYIHHLLGRPHHDVPALELYQLRYPASVRPTQLAEHSIDDDDYASIGSGYTDRLVDYESLRDYDRRIRQLRGDIERAERDGDVAGRERAQTELDRLLTEVRETTRPTGRGSQPRSFKTALTKPIDNVRKAIRTSLCHIGARHSALHTHLDNTIRTGATCKYSPEKPTDWEL